MNRLPKFATQRRRILWIPHTSWAQCRSQRPWFLINGLADRFEQHVLTWSARPTGTSRSYYLNPFNHLHALTTHSRKEPFGFVHTAGVPLPVLQTLSNGYPSDRVIAFAQFRFQHRIRALHRTWKFDAIVISASHHFTGYPPKLSGVPCLFDYVDTSPPEVEKFYITQADSITSVSQFLRDRVMTTYGRECLWIPNGLHLEKIRNGDRLKGRAKWGLDGKIVVSLIGLTCSNRLYFLESLSNLKSEFPNILFVAAGCGAIASAIESKARKLRVPTLMTGWLDHEDLPDLYAATDIGLYPGNDDSYFDGACPLKVLEYAGAGITTIVNQSAELRKLNFPNMIVCPATIDGFTSGIRNAIFRKPVQTPEIENFDWGILTKTFGDQLERVMSFAPRNVR